MIYLNLGIIITKGTYIFYVKYMLRGRKNGFLFTREETSFHLPLSDISLPEPNRSFNSSIADYKVFCMLLFRDITQWKSILRIHFPCFKKPAIIAHTPLHY